MEKYEYQDPLMLSAAMEAPELHRVLHDNVILTTLSRKYQPSKAYLQIRSNTLWVRNGPGADIFEHGVAWAFRQVPPLTYSARLDIILAFAATIFDIDLFFV